MSEIVFTPSALLDLLSQVDELKDVDIGITETLDNQIQLQIGESIYVLSDDTVTDISVDASVVDTVEDVNFCTYEDLASSGDIDINSFEPVESGILKEVAKTLLVGGMVRLSAKLLK